MKLFKINIFSFLSSWASKSNLEEDKKSQDLVEDSIIEDNLGSLENTPVIHYLPVYLM